MNKQGEALLVLAIRGSLVPKAYKLDWQIRLVVPSLRAMVLLLQVLEARDLWL
jgi:hypothetical protein